MMRERELEKKGSAFVRFEGRNDFRDNLFSVFIDNLNPVVDQAYMWGIFKPHGRVRNIFLYAKNKSRGSVFAFIRFKLEEEASRMAKRVDGMHVYGWLIRAKLASYGWNMRRSGEENKVFKKAKESVVLDRSKGGQSWYGENHEQSKHKSFSDIVKGYVSNSEE
ncbi:hypothetical protein Ddye_018580 [Dipteronia dyeriana]|uniref:RRM domain-containing protein n=1 Tax=Dipteronia dyeriana TaxID=168575 RepID=A0AAD9X1J6_9ROSI|nr:hypothetical protein Ddye_018580 [Dipteronia dyeriana]